MLSLIIFTLLLISPTYTFSSTDDDNINPPYHHCPDNTGYTYTSGSIFEENLNHTLHTLIPPHTSRNSSSELTYGTGIDQIYALYYCRGDADADTCYRCIQDAIQEIVHKCEFKKQGIVWYEFCTLRYANYTIFSLNEESPSESHYNHTSLVSNPILEPHRQLFNNTMNDLIRNAAHNGSRLGFAANEANLSSSLTLRGLAQCSPFISSDLCETCLTAAFRQMDLWSNTILFLPSCNIGFELLGSSLQTERPSSRNPDTQSTERSKVVIIGVLIPVIVILLLLGGFWLWRRRRRSPGAGSVVVEPNIEEPRMQLTRFTHSQVKAMTNEFERVLGEGGYGIVYYGRLTDPDREVAVKVLSKNDAPMQFSNEIKVLGRIYHKNLVSLIGYCEEGTSNLALIYEYMSGGDLKALLSERSGDAVSWKTRLAIAFDTAQGLDYLHTGCSPSIIHRDVKPANILLNQNLQAKVADFGFSKIFPADFVSKLPTTRVIGTPGYVDPQ
ncbi:hypothetical protein BVRB_3g054750 [Beta vulgaris subsp. vulgaris]|nr:hypothetical protein BVRB_3g054750 [Beta vulgaris subsp. vulgaris]